MLLELTGNHLLITGDAQYISAVGERSRLDAEVVGFGAQGASLQEATAQVEEFPAGILLEGLFEGNRELVFHWLGREAHAVAAIYTVEAQRNHGAEGEFAVVVGLLEAVVVLTS